MPTPTFKNYSEWKKARTAYLTHKAELEDLKESQNYYSERNPGTSFSDYKDIPLSSGRINRGFYTTAPGGIRSQFFQADLNPASDPGRFAEAIPISFRGPDMTRPELQMRPETPMIENGGTNLFKQPYTSGGGRAKISGSEWVEYSPEEWKAGKMAYGGEIIPEGDLTAGAGFKLNPNKKFKDYIYNDEGFVSGAVYHPNTPSMPVTNAASTTINPDNYTYYNNTKPEMYGRSPYVRLDNQGRATTFNDNMLNQWKQTNPNLQVMPQMGYGGKLPKHAWGATVGSLVGMGIGSLIAPGIGTTIGGQLGGGLGSMADNRIEENKRLDRDLAINQTDPNAEIAAQMIQSTGGALLGQMKYGGRVPRFALGGQSFQPTAEVENEEVAMYPNGSTEVFKGDIHGEDTDKDGFEGIPKELPPNTKIFSDRMKLGKHTFAALANKYKNDKWQKVLDNPRASTMDKETASRMVAQNTERLTSLFEIQESKKAPKFAKGGKISKYPNGGRTTMDEERFNPDQYAIGDNRDFTYMGLNPFDPNEFINPQDQDYTEIIPNTSAPNYNAEEAAFIPSARMDRPSTQVSSDRTSGRNFLEQAAMYAPTAYNVGMGLFSRPDQLDSSAFTSTERLRPRDVNMDPILRGIDEQAQVGRNAAKTQGFSRGSYMSNLLAINNQAEANKAKALTEDQNINNRNQQSVDTFNINLGLSDNQQRGANYDYNLRSQGKKSEFLGKGLEGVSAISQTNKLIGNQRNADAIRLGTLNSILKNYEVPADLQEKILNGTASQEELSSIIKFKKS
jgi:hypothetical protein